jgi:hypothetical protein
MSPHLEALINKVGEKLNLTIVREWIWKWGEVRSIKSLQTNLNQVVFLLNGQRLLLFVFAAFV